MTNFLTHTTAALAAILITVSSLAAVTAVPTDSHDVIISATVLA